MQFSTRQEARDAGQHSRRHGSRAAQDAAREAHWGRQRDKLLRADARLAEAEQRTPREQLNLLDHRLGHGVGAVRERRRLHLLIEHGMN